MRKANRIDADTAKSGIWSQPHPPPIPPVGLVSLRLSSRFRYTSFCLPAQLGCSRPGVNMESREDNYSHASALVEPVTSGKQQYHAPSQITGDQVTLSGAHSAALDGLRGLAILLVFLFHMNEAVSHLRDTWLGKVLMLGSGWGWVGVDLFFVLSGFLITGILVRTVAHPHYFQNFYIRRSLRIFPLFYGVFALLLILTPLLHLQWQTVHLAFLFYGQNVAALFNGNVEHLQPYINLGHFWSLAVEEQFYLVWPFTIWIIRDARKIKRICLVLIGCSIVSRFAIVEFLPGMASTIIYRELPTHCDGLLLGSWLALSLRLSSVEQLERRTRWFIPLASAVLLGILLHTRSVDRYSSWMQTFGLTVLPLLFTRLLLKCLIPGAVVHRSFQVASLRFLGRYSYGIYVNHVLFMPALLLLVHWLQMRCHSRAIGGALFVPLWFAGSVLLAVISFKYLESPFLSLKDRFAPAGSSATRPAPVLQEN
ncbi:acyltransferase [Acidobacteria bacterium AB60]|nr:acyltransferase [Acidobacteria bacterium AB60]